VFVVFRHPASAPSRTLPAEVRATLASVAGPWDVAFEPNLGAPAEMRLTKLEPWTANADPGVKYFSGTATYTKTIQAPQAWFRQGSRVLLDLGTVKDLAEVEVNGTAFGILWKAPYRVDVTGVLKPGANRLRVKVTNQWTNRQIGDRLVPPEKRVFPVPAGRAGLSGPGAQAPPEAGLIGPVTVARVVKR
jgi:hypothetical protein